VIQKGWFLRNHENGDKNMEIMRKSLILFVLIFIFSCGEVGTTSSLEGDSSSSGGVSSSGEGTSSSGIAACLGANCCNGAEFDDKLNFCHEDQLYPLCGNKDYNPHEQGCFEGQLFPKCELNTTRGTCVHNTLLRCRQEGEGETYIRDPLPGMKCENNGTITGNIIDYFDGKRVYKTVQIGSQVWMAENLDFDQTVFFSTDEYPGRSLCYNDNNANCNEYGRLYDWSTAMGLYDKGTADNERFNPKCNVESGCLPRFYQGGGANTLYGSWCPNGFYLPRTEDWQTLVSYAGGASVAAGRLKSKAGWEHNGTGTDSYGFNAKPGGYAFYWGDEFREQGSRSLWWTSTESGHPSAMYWDMISSDTEARNHFLDKGMSMAYVRCLHY
jgi:uncharacterized protein (TIGR02145 family)